MNTCDICVAGQFENSTNACEAMLLTREYVRVLARDGLAALSETSAGIYYIPFKTGCSLVFSYSGQSIPNRLDVKKEKGVKIYFDAVETAARVEQVKVTVARVFADAPALLAKWKPDAVEQLVGHVAAHEVAHLQHMDHSAAFWGAVEQIYGPCAKQREWLRRDGAKLHAFRFED